MSKSNSSATKVEKDLIGTLKARFQKHMYRHLTVEWGIVEKKLLSNKKVYSTVQEMENTGGEPDVVSKMGTANEIFFVDCVSESPAGRRSLCYDKEAWTSRKENRPAGNCIDLAAKMGIIILSDEQYHILQSIETVDQKTSSWILTPSLIRQKGGALFCDYRYGQTFVYHNGASSYYAARGFRGFVLLK